MADTRFTLTLTDDGAKALEALAGETHKSKADLIREALVLREFIHDKIKAGATFLVEDLDKSKTALKFVGW